MDLSVVIPVSERADDVEQLFNEYLSALAALEVEIEFIFVLDGAFSDVDSRLRALQAKGHPIEIIILSRCFGEAVALTAGFDAAKAGKILTLPSYFQLDPRDIPKIVLELESTDLVYAARAAGSGSWIKLLQRRIFNTLVSWLAGSKYSDLGCGARAFRREVCEEIRIYGDQHRFIPLLATRAGFRTREVTVLPSQSDASVSFYGFGIYLRRFLDIVTVFFLVKFTRKPLRFFGLLGSTFASFGLVCVIYVVSERLFLSIALADRPILLIGSLSIVLGVQLFSIGLIGELIIFTHSRSDTEYRVDQFVNIDSDVSVRK